MKNRMIRTGQNGSLSVSKLVTVPLHLLYVLAREVGTMFIG